MLKVLCYSVDNDTLRTIEHHDSLYSLNYIRDNEVTDVEKSKSMDVVKYLIKRVNSYYQVLHLAN